ncbi:branched-chain amino acid transport system permease protein [Rhodoligotrophos appendicifer]|uniref:branched-chain amino acid ABC transporter permease n=1 Tax=Rhodoligotrophos appendicifer TaxID=987056 RepID=UPI001186D8C2|nr:branched-chain amino acid ABC transporter permease [Rhodoligotrophos appendicifer]
MLAQQLLNGLVMGAVYGLFALGFNLIFGVHGILNLAYGAILMVGAFAGLVTVLNGFPLWSAFIIAAIAAGIVSVVIDLVAFRPLRRSNEIEFAAIISSIGADMVLTTLAQRLSNTQVFRFPYGTFPDFALTFLGLRITGLQITIVATVAIMAAGIAIYLYGTSFGRQVRAVAESERAASLLGVNANSVYLQTFFISGAMAGVAGVLVGLAFNTVQFLMGEPYLLRGFVVLIIGGLGSLKGALAAGFLLGLIQALCTAYLPAGLSDPVIYALLFLIILVRPSGIFGSAVKDVRAVRQ